MFPIVPLVDPYNDIGFIDGAYSLSLMMGWGTLVSTPGERLAEISKWDTTAWQKAFRTLPLNRWDRVLGFKVQYLRDWVEHPKYDSYWSGRGAGDELSKIRVPICAVGGWYDIFAKSTLDHVNTVKANSRSMEARRHQHVLMGPWTHSAGNSKVGDIDFGKVAEVNLRQIQTLWFDRWLKGQNNGVDQWSPLRIFVMGRNEWRDEQEWPLKRTRYTQYYFHSKGRANTSNGNGTLDTVSPGNESTDKFVYNPDDPVPTLGGCNLFGCPAGPHDQKEAEARNDVLVFTSRELSSDLEVTGPVKVILYSASSAPDTDWTAKLVDVYPDGRAMNICDGIVRASWYRTSNKLAPIKPDEVYKYEIDLWVTSNVFLQGHRIRVEISSSNFPRFDRNLNTGEPLGAGTTWNRANQSVYHDSEHPSHILLPVIP